MLSLIPYGYIGVEMALRSIRDIAAAVRGRRQDLGLNQAELAARAGVSRKWISEFESGKSTAELGLVLRVLDELGLQLELREEEAKTEGAERSGSIDLDTLLRQLRTPRATDSADE
jgi:y4mF family transcriptional regulator